MSAVWTEWNGNGKIDGPGGGKHELDCYHLLHNSFIGFRHRPWWSLLEAGIQSGNPSGGSFICDFRDASRLLCDWSGDRGNVEISVSYFRKGR